MAGTFEISRTRPALIALVGLACSDTLSPSACLDGVTFTVGPGTEPTFDWKPACRVSQLEVRSVDNPVVRMWSVGSPRPALRPPIRYGEVPDEAGAIGTTPASPLSPGSAYHLRLLATFSTPVGFNSVELGGVDFVP